MGWGCCFSWSAELYTTLVFESELLGYFPPLMNLLSSLRHLQGPFPWLTGLTQQHHAVSVNKVLLQSLCVCVFGLVLPQPESALPI